MDEQDKSGLAPLLALALLVPIFAGMPLMGVGAVAVLTHIEENPAACVVSAVGETVGDVTSTSAVPNGWGDLVDAAAKTAGLPVSVVAAQLKQESGWNEGARSPAGAQGVAQFMPGTWAMYGEGGDPFSAEDAIPAYGRYMAVLKEQVQPLAGDDADLLVRLTLAAYNAGPGAVQAPPNTWQQRTTPMIRHIVLFRVHNGTPQDKIQDASNRLEGLVGSIPGLRSLEAGTDIGTGNYDFGLIAELDDKAALETFSTDKAHMDIAMDILTFRNPEDIAILDYTT